MSYEALQERIQNLPEKYLDQVADYIDFLLFRCEKFGDTVSEEKTGNSDLTAFFGKLMLKTDPMTMQRGMRNEWE